MKRTIEIEDTLQDCVDSAIESVKECLTDYLEQNPDTDETPDLGNDLDYNGSIHEIIDWSVPVYAAEINDIMYLHGHEVNKAFDNAGIGTRDDSWPNCWEAAAIYCYIEQEVGQWFHHNADDIFTDWKEKKESKLSRELEA